MGETKRYIPIRERPYEWAYNEMLRTSCEPQVVRLQTLTEPCADATGNKISFFGSTDISRPCIVRAFWKEGNLVRYSIVDNYYTLKREYPDIVALREKDGVDDYLHAVHDMEIASETHGRSVPYPSLSVYAF